MMMMTKQVDSKEQVKYMRTVGELERVRRMHQAQQLRLRSDH